MGLSNQPRQFPALLIFQIDAQFLWISVLDSGQIIFQQSLKDFRSVLFFYLFCYLKFILIPFSDVCSAFCEAEWKCGVGGALTV